MKTNIPFGDLKAEVSEIRGEVDMAVERVLSSGWFVLGQEGDAFEGEFAAWLGAEYVIGCGNGTDAITLALLALGVGPGDEVITVANTCVPSAVGIRATGCEMKLVDCDPNTLQMDATALRAAITPRTKAVMPVHLYGACPDMAAVSAICRETGVPMIEDCAQAHGASIDGRAAGLWGVMSAWSFYPSKNLGAYGDGGAIATQDAELAEKLISLRNYGQRVRYYHDEEGRNSRLDEMQSAILRAKLPHLKKWNEQRRNIVGIYNQHLQKSAARVLELFPTCVSACHLYPVRVAAANRDAIRESMQGKGIATQIHYPVPIHRQKAYAPLFEEQNFPVAEVAANELLTLPLYPQMTDAEAHHVGSTFVSVLADFHV